MTLEQKIDLLLARQITKTRFISIEVPVTDNNAASKPVPLGDGKCKAVILHLNNFLINSDNYQLSGVVDSRVYYGDANQQTMELLQAVVPTMPIDDALNRSNPLSSELIFCTNLQEVFVRAYATGAGSNAKLMVEAIVYE